MRDKVEQIEKPIVSVICMTYNHEAYIREALDGFVMQKTDFPFEVIVHDDASTDGTAGIIREYLQKYPELIRAILQTENQYSKGVNIQYDCVYPEIRGEYTAMCEGDDYWTDPMKLQKQYDFFQNNPGVDICAHRAIAVRDGEEVGLLGPERDAGIIPFEEVLLGGGGFVATNSLMIRTENLTRRTPFRDVITFDYTMQIQGALRGGMGYIPDCMSAYRRGVAGSWTDRNRYDRQRLQKHREKLALMFVELDKYTEGKYSEVLDIVKRRNQFELLMTKENYREMLKKEYRDIFREKPFKRKVKILLMSIIKG